jgi:hypothetical protein
VSKCTPGSYECVVNGFLDDYQDDVFVAVVKEVGGNGEELAAVIAAGDISEEEALANGRLFAAAPDLLEACKDLLEHEGAREVNGIGMECDSVALERAKQLARAAVAKAEGLEA